MKNDDMPTQLMRRTSWRESVTETTSKEQLLSMYRSLLNLTDTMQNSIDVQKEYIDMLEEQLQQKTEVDQSSADRDVGKRKTKCVGASFEFDPIRKSFGLGFHFKEA